MCILSSFYIYLYTYFHFVIWPNVGFKFDMLFLFFRNAPFTLRRLWSLYPVKREAALFVHIRPYFIYFFIFRLQATFAGESSETILFFVVPRGSEEGPVKLDVRIE